MSIATVGEENPQEATAGRAVATGSRAAGQGTRRRQILTHQEETDTDDRDTAAARGEAFRGRSPQRRSHSGSKAGTRFGGDGRNEPI